MDPIRVLLIGGNPALLNLIKLFLEQQERLVVVGVYPEVKPRLDQAYCLQPQVAICDLGTPGLTGLETIACLHTMMPEVGIVATTLLRANGYQEVALSAGADAVIVQAELNTRLLPAVERAARERHSANGVAVK